MTNPDGRYAGTIVNAFIAEDVFAEGQYVLKLEVNLVKGGAVTCRQSLRESERDRRDETLKAIGLVWPLKSTDMARLTDLDINVNLKTSKKNNQNAYVATLREERVLTPEEIDALSSQLDDDAPF